MMAVAKVENERLSNIFIQQFQDQLDQAQLPQMNTKKFNDLFHQYKEETLSNFRTEAMFDAEKFEQRLSDALEKMFREKKEENLKLVKKHCKEELERLYKELVGDQPDKYHHAGGYSEYKVNMGKVKVAYKKNFIDTDKSTVQDVMNSFLNRESEVENQIMDSDHKLSEAERKEEIKRIEKEHAEAEKRRKEEFERQRQEDQRRNDEHMRRVDAEKAEFKRQQDQNNRAMMEQWNQNRVMVEKQMELMKDEQKRRDDQHNQQLEQMRMNHEAALQREENIRIMLEREREERERRYHRNDACYLM